MKAVDTSRIIESSCAGMIDHVEAGSLDAIFTDPPYLREFMPTYSELADFAVHALRPGGIVITMCGQMFLDECFRRLSVDGLSYLWMVAFVYVKCRAHVHATKITNGWKPLIVFKRDGAGPGDRYRADTFRAMPRQGSDKSVHPWGQSLRDMHEIAQEWLRPGWKVCDPFVGGGALLEAAKAVGCEVSGCDVSPMYVRHVRERLIYQQEITFNAAAPTETKAQRAEREQRERQQEITF